LMHGLPSGPQTMINVAKGARARGFRVVLKAAPVPQYISTIKEFLDSACVDVLVANEFEAPILLGWNPQSRPPRPKPCVTIADANEAASSLMEKWSTLSAVVVHVYAGCVLRERKPGLQRAMGLRVAEGPGDSGRVLARAENFRDGSNEGEAHVFVLPSLHGKDVDIVGASDAFVGGFVAALCHGLSGAQGLLWGEGASRRARMVAGAQTGMPTQEQLLSLLAGHLRSSGAEGLLSDPKHRSLPDSFLAQSSMHLDVLRGNVVTVCERLHQQRKSNAAPAARDDPSRMVPASQSPVAASATALQARVNAQSVTETDSAETTGRARANTCPTWGNVLLARVLQYGRTHFGRMDAMVCAAMLRHTDVFGVTPLQRAAVCYMHVPQYKEYAEILLALMMSHCALLSAGLLDEAKPRARRFLHHYMEEGVIARIYEESAILQTKDGFEEVGTRLIPDVGSLADKTNAEAAALLMIALLLPQPSRCDARTEHKSEPHVIELVYQYCQLALDNERGANALRNAIMTAQLPNEGHTMLTAAAQIGAHWLVTLLLTGGEAAEASALIETRLASGWSALHFAAQGRHFYTCVQLLVHGADISATNNEGDAPLYLVPAKERARFEELKLLGSMGFGAFISHCKAESQTEARNLKELVEQHLKRRAFLDSDDLSDLNTLCEQVRESDVLVLIQTRRVLSRPWCVIELLTAIDEGVPIVCVVPVGLAKAISYDFTEAQQLLDNFEEEIDRQNPGAMEEIRENYNGHSPLGEVLARMKTELPRIISKRVDYSMSRRVLNAMLEDVLDAIKTQSAWRLNLRMQAAQKSLTVDPTPPGQLARKHSLGRPLLRDLEQFLRPTGSDEIRDVVQAEADGEDGEEGSNGDSPPGTVSKNGTDAAARKKESRRSLPPTMPSERTARFAPAGKPVY